MARSSSGPVIPGVPVDARRPGVFNLVPVASITVVATVAGAVTLLAWGSQYLAACLSGLFAVGAYFWRWERERRSTDYRELVAAIGQLTAAWASLKRASSISWAIESNIELADSRFTGKLAPNRAKLKEIIAELRNVGDLSRPTTLATMRERRDRRYEQVAKLNRDLVALLAQSRSELPLMDEKAMSRLYVAYENWESAIACAKGVTCRWPLLEALVDRVNALVHYWWLFPQNDPYYRLRDKRRENERKRAFKQADEFVRLFDEGIRRRDIGRRWPRALMMRLTIGRRTAANLDVEKDAIA